MLTRKKISVIPIAYRDEGNIKELYQRLVQVLKKLLQTGRSSMLMMPVLITQRKF